MPSTTRLTGDRPVRTASPQPSAPLAAATIPAIAHHRAFNMLLIRDLSLCSLVSFTVHGSRFTVHGRGRPATILRLPAVSIRGYVFRIRGVMKISSSRFWSSTRSFLNIQPSRGSRCSAGTRSFTACSVFR